jgi:hypothetical protein
MQLIKEFVPLNDIENFSQISKGLELGYESEWIPCYLPSNFNLEVVPFAFWLIKSLKPELLLELGINNGVVYMSFCQAVQRLEMNTKCYAFDSWESSACKYQSQYEEDIYKSIVQYNTSHYASFSSIIRTPWNKVSSELHDKNIDLLYFHNYNSYGLLKNDFDILSNKMSNRGIILIDNINIKSEFNNSDIHRFWTEVISSYPSFSFDVGRGLGVLGIGKAIPESIKFLLKSDEVTSIKIQTIFGVRGMNLIRYRSTIQSERQIYNSLSWRISSPLRSINKLLSYINIYQKFYIFLRKYSSIAF